MRCFFINKKRQKRCTLPESCVNTGVVKAINGKVGGIAGYSLFDDKGHDNVESIIVACYSTSTELSGSSYVGLLVGQQNKGYTIGSWASSVGNLPLVKSNNTDLQACYKYDSAANVTEADVVAMNAAIDTFNTDKQATDYNYCPYKWVYVAGSYPVLQ